MGSGIVVAPYRLVILRQIGQSAIEAFTQKILQVMQDLPLDGVEAVALPAAGAGKYIIGLRVIGSLKRKIAGAAFDRGVLVSHSSLHY